MYPGLFADERDRCKYTDRYKAIRNSTDGILICGQVFGEFAVSLQREVGEHRKPCLNVVATV